MTVSPIQDAVPRIFNHIKLFSDATVGARQVRLDIDLFQTVRT